MIEKCKARVSNLGSMPVYSHQCTFNAVKDGYCKRHHPDAVKIREEKQREKCQKQLDNSPLRMLKTSAEQLEKANAKIVELEQELKQANNTINSLHKRANLID
ncbi:MAG: hypothetical protein WCS56_00240 [Bacilli bacterium]